MKPLKLFFIIALLILFSENVLLQGNCNKILFLNFRFIKGAPELVSMTVVDGKLKIRKNGLSNNAGFSFVLISNQNKIIYKNNFDDPTQNIQEYPGDNGEIKRIAIKKDTVHYSIRVPYSKDINKIILYKTDTKPSLSKSSTNSFEAKYEFIVDHSLIKLEN